MPFTIFIHYVLVSHTSRKGLVSWSDSTNACQYDMRSSKIWNSFRYLFLCNTTWKRWLLPTSNHMQQVLLVWKWHRLCNSRMPPRKSHWLQWCMSVSWKYGLPQSYHNSRYLSQHFHSLRTLGRCRFVEERLKITYLFSSVHPNYGLTFPANYSHQSKMS